GDCARLHGASSLSGGHVPPLRWRVVGRRYREVSSRTEVRDLSDPAFTEGRVQGLALREIPHIPALVRVRGEHLAALGPVLGIIERGRAEPHLAEGRRLAQ